MTRFITLIILLSIFAFSAQSQINIFELMERKDLRMDEIETIADAYFKQVGKERGSGYKQYSRWHYEQNFHLYENGYFIAPETENTSYQKFVGLQKQNKASYKWNELGPTYWKYTSGWNPGVGRITSVAVHPADTTKIYVSSPGGGIWKSTNSGNNWTPLMDNISSSWMNIFNLAIDPSDQNTIFAAVVSGGVIKSTDAGTTWKSTGNGPSSSKKVLIHPTNSNIVLCTGSNGIWRSTNGGTAWTQVNTVSMEDIEFNPIDSKILYASGSSSSGCVWRSKNNGVSWVNISSTNGITATGRTLIGVSPSNPAIVYAVQASGSLFGKFYKSSDTGLTFTTLITGSTSGSNYFGYETNGSGTKGQATYDMAICVNPKDIDEVHIAGIICWKSTDGGSTFKAETQWQYPTTLGYNHADVHALEWVNGTIYSGSDGGVYKSMNYGAKWTDISVGLGIKQFYKISCSKTDNKIITGGAQDNGSCYRKSAGNWVDWLGADGMDNLISPTNAAVAIGTSQNGDIYKTVNSGGSYSKLTKPSSGNWVTPLAMHPNNHDTVYGGWTGIYRSLNGGSNWTLLSSGTITGMLTTIAVAPSDVNYIYGSIGSTLYVTKNGGQAWSTYTAPNSITSIFISQNNPEKIWITCNSSSQRVYVSNNMGANYTDLSSGLPSLSARTIVVQNNALESTYLGMNIGVYYKDNNNPKWVLYGDGLPLVAINDLEIQETSGQLRVGTYGRGIWEVELKYNSDCIAPNIRVSKNLSTTSTLLNWKIVSEAKTYTIEYKIDSASIWGGAVTISDTFLLITGLKSGTKYHWRIRTNCPAYSKFETDSFITAYTCTIPLNLKTDSIKQKSAYISWNKIAGSQGYAIQYKEFFSSSWDKKVIIYDTFLNVNALEPFTKYAWRVKSNCLFDSSTYVQLNFTTLDCGTPTNLKAGSFTLSNATVSWDAIKEASSYTVENKLSSASIWATGLITNDTFLKLYGLTSGTYYNWRVKSNCSNNYGISNFMSGVNSINNILSEKTQLILYPNPASRLLFYSIIVNSEVKGLITTITNIEGEELYKNVLNISKGQVSDEIALDNFSNGMYYLIIKSQNGIKVQKFVILK